MEVLKGPVVFYQFIFFILTFRWIKKEYKNPEVIISENGWSDDGRLNDVDRVEYLKDHLTEVVKAVRNDGCNVKGYTVWSIIDNFEWLSGYT